MNPEMEIPDDVMILSLVKIYVYNHIVDGSILEKKEL